MDSLFDAFLSMSTIPIILLGIGATAKYAWKILYKKDMKNIGAFVSTLYLTLVYVFILSPLEFHGQSFVRIGVLMLFTDKVIVFIYDIISEYKSKKKTGNAYAE